MRVLVTGATGFIGWHTTRQLIEEGHEVRALVRNPEKAERVLGPLGVSEADRIVGEMTNPAAVKQALEGCDAVVHAAASVDVASSASAGSGMDANVEGARVVLGASSEHGVRSILFVSSVTAIFDPRADSLTAESPLVAHTSGYTKSKSESDRFARGLQDAGAPVTIVYPPGVIGPDDTGLSESMRAYRGFLRGTLKAGSTPQIDVRDLALLNVRLLERAGSDRVLAAGRTLSWDELTAILETFTERPISRLALPGWAMRAAGRVADGVSRVSGRTLPLTYEGLAFATLWKPARDSALIAELGIEWRDPAETLADAFRWMVEAGRLPAKAVPGLVSEAPDRSPPPAGS